MLSRVDLSFRKTGDTPVHLNFGLRNPEKEQYRLPAAYLCQSLPIVDDCNDAGYVGKCLQKVPTFLP